MEAELCFAVASAELFSKFTSKFQSEEPLIHLLYKETKSLIQTLAGRVCKSQVLQIIRKSEEFDGDSLFQEKNLLPLEEVVITTDIRSKLSVLSQKDRLQFLKCAQSHYITGCKYIMEKIMPVSSLVKALSCLHPSERTTSSSCSDIITVCKALPVDVAEDLLLDEWKLLQLENDMPNTYKCDFLRIDSYWHQLLTKNENYDFCNVSKVVKAALALCHGNADIERRFSVSRWALTEDKASMSERTLNAILVTKDALREYHNYPHLVPITRKLISLGQNAYKHYKAYLEEQKQLSEIEEAKKKEADKIDKITKQKKKEAEEMMKKILKDEQSLKERKKESEQMEMAANALFTEATERQWRRNIFLSAGASHVADTIAKNRCLLLSIYRL